MENADAQFAMLLSMGYTNDYIERAIDVHKKSKYGTNFNLNILVEIIGRLQEKDQQLEIEPSQPPQLQQSHSHNDNKQPPQLQLQQSHSHNDNKPYYGFLGGYNDGLSSDSDEILSNEKKEQEFRPHYMNIEEPLKLHLNDFVDYRYENGRYLLCKIIGKAQVTNMMLLHPVGKPIYDTKYDRLVDIYQEYFKLSPAKSICLRKQKSICLKINDYVDVNPFFNQHKGWVNAKIIKVDPNSSQIKVIYHYGKDNKNYSFWVHLENKQEVAEFGTKCKHLDKHQIILEKKIFMQQRSGITIDNTYINDIDNTKSLITINEEKEKEEEEEEEEILEEEEEKEEDEQEEEKDILQNNLECNDISDNEICMYLLKYDKLKWEFNHISVEIYRLMMNNINHTLMLPHPISIRFPQYLSDISIPKKKQFFANVLPPKNKHILKNISIKQWRVRIIINETSTKELINKIVLKLQNSFDINKKFDYNSSQFILKVVGCEEYILYDENKLIINYEAVRKAVRNENNVKFQLLYFSNFKQIEKECFNKNMHHISKYKRKYENSNLLTDEIITKHNNNKTLKYCPYSYGDGSYGDGLNELKELKQDEFDIIPLSDFANNIMEQFDDNNCIFSNLPSMKDSKYLIETCCINNTNEIFLHNYNEYYNIKILFLLNVTQFPLYKHYTKNTKNIHKKYCIICRHDLWIGNQKYDECTFNTDYKHKISDGMRFNELFYSSKYKYCDLSRESCISFTVYLCKLNDDKPDNKQEIPIAFVRFPIISECNLLRTGKHSLNLWPVPLFIPKYKGAKCDTYENLHFKFNSTTVDRHLKKYNNKELQNVFKLGIEINKNKNNKHLIIIGLPLNYKWKYNKNNYKIDNIEECNKIISYDPLREYNDEEKQIIWKHRDILIKKESTFTSFIRCIDFRDKYQRSELYDYIEKWSYSNSNNNVEDLLGLLSYQYMDNYIREYVIMRISKFTDNDLQIYLLQLVQCLKYELYHNNALIRLLMRRALLNPNQIGHYFYWHLKSEFNDNKQLNLMYLERFALYLEEYLLFSQIGIARNILIQSNISKALMYINNKLRKYNKEYKGNKNINLKEIMHSDLNKLNKILPTNFILPINPKWHCTKIVIEECKLMSSAQLPLWLSFKNCDESVGNENTIMMFKAGDDLRQDILTLSMIRVIDKIWLDRGLNLSLLFYNVISTGYGQGMVQIVLNSRTTTYIHTHYGGGPQKGARDITTHLKYIKQINNNNVDYINKARDIYTRSTAGYCIASYVLGLGDRHPSNIMVRTKGELFHIDFSHFLGNFKSQKVIGDYVKWQREVAPFVFLPANKYCITNGNKDENNYNTFINYCVNAYLSLRQRHKLLINLFILMLPSQMPELIIKEHINYLRDQLHLYDIKNDNVHKHINKILNVCLNDKRRIMDNIIHAMVHK